MKKLIRWALPWLAAACMHNPVAAYAQAAPQQFQWGGLIIPADRLVDVDTLTSTQYAARESYQQWMDEVTACAGIPSFGVDSIAWVSVPGSAFRHGHGEVRIAESIIPNDTVLIVEAYIGHKQLVSHEMLHIALARAGRPFKHTEADSTFKACGVLGQ